MGVPSAYSSFDQVPRNKRFDNYEDQFEGRDVWAEYVNKQFSEEIGTPHKRKIQLVERSWKQFCDEKGCHHALATPTVIYEWCEELLEDRKPSTVSSGYLTVVNKFYRYLMWNVDYPQIYNPVQFAAREFDTVSKIEGYYGGDVDE
jgi:hypothetical protein